MRKTLVLIDGSSSIYRAYHAIPRLTTSAGVPTNAVYGFTQTLKKILKAHKPDYAAVCFDVKGPTLRHALFEEYKVERPPMPDDLTAQIPYIKKITKAFGIAQIEKGGYEADDVIATVVKRFSAEGLGIVIVTGDKDMLQLVGDAVKVLDQAKEVEYGKDEVVDKFKVAPELITDVIGLCGDASDGIPGVKGVGPKTAASLIKKFGSLEKVFEKIDEITPEALRKKLSCGKDAALLSKKLATLSSDIPIPLSLEELAVRKPDPKELEGVLRELEFSKLVKELRPVEAPAADMPRAETEEELRALVRTARAATLVSVILDGNGVSLATTAGRWLVTFPASDSAILRELIEDGGIKKTTDDSKPIFLYFLEKGAVPRGFSMDASIAYYLLNPGRPSSTLEDAAYEFLGERADTLTAKLSLLLRLTPILEKKLAEQGLKGLFEKMEMPLSAVLARMELKGIRVDGGRLRELSEKMEARRLCLEKEVFGRAGYRFNLSSPRQLSHFLFEKLALKPIRRTKTGYSTDEAVLAALSKTHDIAATVLEHRRVSKLKGTYVDGLLKLINPSTGRVHTSFNQTATATGRLSSSNPNLQNIPVRGEFADEIRAAFVAEEGKLLLAADYSQIELRLVAHFSEDPLLIDAFRGGEDIHALTAAELFGTVTDETRRRAKAVNFGIIYGMGERGLAEGLEIDPAEARDYISAYFGRHAKVREFIENTVREAVKRGYTETLFGRRRYIPELKSPVESVRRLGERIAVNSPVQGSAADIIKAAMIAVDRDLPAQAPRSALILQIHDELVVEAHKDELDRASELVKRAMEDVVKLKVPLRVNMTAGENRGGRG